MARIELGSPQEKELTSLVFTKLAEFGWPDNDVLANFIVVMVANEKTRDEITSELSDSKAAPSTLTFSLFFEIPLLDELTLLLSFPFICFLNGNLVVPEHSKTVESA